MFCKNCGTKLSDGARFCPVCGTAQGASGQEIPKITPDPSQNAAPNPAMNAAPNPAAAHQEAAAPAAKKKSRLPLLIGIVAGALVLIAGFLVVLFTVILPAVRKDGGKKRAEELTVPFGYEVYADEVLGVSFVYPENAMVKARGEEGIYVYPGGERGLPSVLITREKKVSSPEKYYKKFISTISGEFSKVEEGKILKADTEKEEVYLLRSEVEDRGEWHFVDQFIELSGNQAVGYRVESEKEAELDAFVKNLIESLRTSAEAYEDAEYETAEGKDASEAETQESKEAEGSTEAVTEPAETTPSETTPAETEPSKTDAQETEETESETAEATAEETEEPETTEETQAPSDVSLKDYASSEVNISISMPASLNTEDIGTGFFGVSEEMAELCMYRESSESFFMLYNADDFIALADQNLSFLTESLYLDSVEVSNVKQTEIGGLPGYELDASMTMAEFSGAGKIYVLSTSNNIGVYLLYYMISDGAADAASLEAAAEKSIESFRAAGEPNDYSLALYGSSNASFLFVCDPEEVTGYEPDEDKLVLSVAAYDGGEDGSIVIKKNDFHSEGVSTANGFLKEYTASVGLSEDLITDYEYGGRYGFQYIQASYTGDGGEDMTLFLLACEDSAGCIYTILADDLTERMEDYDYIISDMVWSFRVAE